MAMVGPECGVANMSIALQRKILDMLANIASKYGGVVGRDKILARFIADRLNWCTACGIDFYQSRRSNWQLTINNVVVGDLDGTNNRKSIRIVFPCRDYSTCNPPDPNGKLLGCISATDPPCHESGKRFCGNQTLIPADDNYCVLLGCNFVENSVVGFDKSLGVSWTLRSDPADPPTDTTFGFPIGSQYVPEEEEPPIEEYEWGDEYNDIQCQLDSMPDDTIRDIAIGLPYVLEKISNIICCSPRPCYLILVDDWYAEVLIVAVRHYYLTMQLILFFPRVPGSIANYDGTNIGEERCYHFKYVFTESEITLLDVKSDYERFIQHFVDTVNQINDTKMTVALKSYGLNIQEQNTEKDEGNHIDIDLEIQPVGKRGDRYSLAVDIVRKVFSYFHN